VNIPPGAVLGAGRGDVTHRIAAPDVARDALEERDYLGVRVRKERFAACRIRELA